MPVPSRTTRAEAKYNVTTEFPHLGLHSAAATGNIGLVKYALSHGQPINSVLDGVLPLHAAASGGNDLVVKLLIQYGADVNAPRLPRRYSNDKNRDASAPIVGTSGSTPLHFAAANGHTSVVSTLLHSGAQPDRPDKHGITPEILARQKGWLECADLLKDWAFKKGRESLERSEEGVKKECFSRKERSPSSGALAPLDREGSTRRRLLVKRSVDQALNSFKSTLNNRSETHLARLANTSPAPPSPTSKPLGIYSFYSSSPRSTDDLSCRRPSLPEVYGTSPPPPPPNHTPRRPQSAGNDGSHENEDESGHPLRRLGSKYSLLNLFKRAGEFSPNLTPDRSLPSSDSPSPGVAPSSPPVTPFPQSSTADPSTLPLRRFRKGSDSSPSRPLESLASTVEVHGTLPNHSRDLSASSISKTTPVFEDDERASPSSPSGRPSILRAHNRATPSNSPQRSQASSPQLQSRALRFNSTSSMTSLSGHRSGVNHRMDLMSGRASTLPTSRFRSRSSSSLRAGIVGVMPADTSIPESAPATSEEFRNQVRINIEADEDEEYGRPIWTSVSVNGSVNDRPHLGILPSECIRGSSFASSLSSLSPILSPDAITIPEFPFGDVPADDVDQNSLVVPGLRMHPKDQRHRGDSVSSASTDSSADPQLTMSGTTATSDGSGTITLPSHSSLSPITADHSIPVITGGETPNDPTSPIDDGEQWSPELLYSSLSERRAHAPLDINIRSISSHAQAEALVQRRQQSILEMANELDDQSHVVTGHTPLSAKLAAYGESLALERRLKKEEEEKAKRTVVGTRTNLDRSVSNGSPRIGGERVSLDRGLSLERRSEARRREPRRPNTSHGFAAEFLASNRASIFPVDSTARQLTHKRSFASRTRQDGSLPVADGDSGSSSGSSPPRAALKNPSFSPPPVRSRTPEPDAVLDATEDLVDVVLLAPGSIATSPEPLVVLDDHDDARHIASASKLSRMGFATTDGWRPSSTSPTLPRGGSKAKFGLKSIMQTFKGKS